MVELIVRPDAETGSTTALANMSEEIYERLTTVFKYTKFDVCRSLENGTITISRLMYDADGEFMADIDIEFKDGYATVYGYFDGFHSGVEKYIIFAYLNL